MKTAKATAARAPERPIIFSAPMIRALLAGTKTQTRRPIKGVPSHWSIPPARFDDGYLNRYGVGRDGESIKCPFGKPGDKLWVRETCQRWMLPNILTGEPTNAEVAYYAADETSCLTDNGFNLGAWWKGKTCPSIFMPRWASRITLEITEVRVERLQDISEEDAVAEGITGDEALVGQVSRPFASAYLTLWESLHGVGSAETNPFVWVLSFKRIDDGQLTNNVEAK